MRSDLNEKNICGSVHRTGLIYSRIIRSTLQANEVDVILVIFIIYRLKKNLRFFLHYNYHYRRRELLFQTTAYIQQKPK